MAKNDIRLDIGILRNLKIKRFARAHNADMSHPVLCLQRLWFYCAEHAPKGVIHQVAPPDLEGIMEWTGEPGVLIASLEAHALCMPTACPEHAGSNAGCYEVHDWPVHQGYIFHADTRSELASMAARIGWDKRRKGMSAKMKDHPKQRDMRGASGGHASRKAKAMSGQSVPRAPSPTPAPAPIAGQGIGDSSSSSALYEGATPTPEELRASRDLLVQGFKMLAPEKVTEKETENEPAPTAPVKGNGGAKTELPEVDEAEHETLLLNLMNIGCTDPQAYVAVGCKLAYIKGDLSVYHIGDRLAQEGITGMLKIKVYEVLGL